MSRLVVASNRVGPVKGAAIAGGLAVGLVDALRENGGLWFGWSGKTCAPGKARLHTEEVEGLTLATLDLTQADYEGYYNGFANDCLWPVLHFRIDLAHFSREHLDAYRRVNFQFARALKPLLQDDDLVWVHDFHLFPLASNLRARGVRQKIGFFLHTPFPPTEILCTLPQHDWILRSLFDYDLIGFQTEEDLDRFRDHIRRTVKGKVDGHRVRAYGRVIQARTFPIGIDVEQFHQFAFTSTGEREYQRMRTALMDGRMQIVGVDRLDYSKGLLRRMAAFDEYLESHAEVHGKIIYLQVAPVSRGWLQAYREFRHQLEHAAADINGRYGRFDWTPVHYLSRALPRRTLAGLYRASRIALVTPVRDGMNLVAKEYVAAQDPEDPGVLILSQFAGAAKQLTQALLVNPFDTTEMAQALHKAHEMSLTERRKRHAALMRSLRRYDVKRWREEFVAALRGRSGRRRRAASRQAR